MHNIKFLWLVSFLSEQSKNTFYQENITISSLVHKYFYFWLNHVTEPKLTWLTPSKTTLQCTVFHKQCTIIQLYMKFPTVV